MVAASSLVRAHVCILGGGPHGLAAALHLRWADPDASIVSIDPAGAWLEAWRTQFARADITTLRSPIVHHPAPGSMALRDHVARWSLPTSGLPYDVPTTTSFDRFCCDTVDQADLDDPIAGTARSIERLGPGVLVDTGDTTVHADHLVIATNPHRRIIPDWVHPLLGAAPGVLTHGADVDLAEESIQGHVVTVVGGGLTAAHLACGAIQRGAEVHLVSRRPIRSRSFDTDPGWLGPKHLARFSAEPDPLNRLQMARAARGGGTIPPWMKDRLDAAVDADQLTIHDGAGVRAADVDARGRCRLALGDHSTLEADRVWLATGTRPDIGALRCLEDLVADLPVVHGYPVTGPDLRLGDHPIHVMGRLATLALGPAAGNLWGAQRAAEQITEAIAGSAMTLEPKA
jgi:cation diffusion facilitator CzcD-associated flavoprotein CzcO